MKKTSFVVMALSVVFMAMGLLGCSVWAAGGLPQVEIRKNIMIFPKEDKIVNLDLSKFAIGRGLENVPQIYKPLIGNIYRAEWSGGNGYKWYIFLGAYVNKEIKFLVNSSAFGFPFIIVCPEDNEKEGFNCYVEGAKEGSVSSFLNRYKIILKNGLPVIYQNNENAEFYEAGKYPEELWKKTAASNVPLPEYEISQSSPTDPPEVGQLLGVWSGNWGGLDSTLVVMEISVTEKRAKVIYAWGDYPIYNIKKGYSQTVAEFIPGAKPTIKWGQGTSGSKFEFILNNGKLDGSRQSSANRDRVTMTKNQ